MGVTGPRGFRGWTTSLGIADGADEPTFDINTSTSDTATIFADGLAGTVNPDAFETALWPRW